MKGNGKSGGPASVEMVVSVPTEIPKELAQVLVQQFTEVIKAVKPLMPPKDMGELISGALRDMKMLSEFQQMLAASPPGTKFGAGVKRQKLIIGLEGGDEGVLMSAFAHQADCKSSVDFMHWVTAQALLGSAEARIILALNGFTAVFQPPQDVAAADADAV